MNDFKFSVAMCVYGGDNEKYFEEALESIYKQTLLPNEVILIVDGPIPNSIDIVIKKYEQKENFFVYRYKENKGHGFARNESLKHCNYNYVAIVDSDDINREDRFEKQINLFKQKPNLSVISSNSLHFNGTIDNILNEEQLPVNDSDIKKRMKTRCSICQASAMLNKTKVEQVGGYKDWYYAEDYYLWIRLMLAGYTFENIPENLLYIRTSDDQINRRGGIAYFKSMRKLYKYMHKNKIINYWTYLYNVVSRFIIQVLIHNKLRGFIRKKML